MYMDDYKHGLAKVLMIVMVILWLFVVYTIISNRPCASYEEELDLLATNAIVDDYTIIIRDRHIRAFDGDDLVYEGEFLANQQQCVND